MMSKNSDRPLRDKFLRILKSCLWAGILVASLHLILACATSPTGRKQFIVVSDQQMNLLGDQAFQQMKKELPKDSDPKTRLYVDCIVRALSQFVPSEASGENWEVVIFKDKSANAFALPGGKIGVYTGMLRVAQTPGQLAAVIGHEIGHVMARHGAERASTVLATQTGLVLVDALAKESRHRNEMMGVLGIGAQFGVILPHGRRQELEADEIGLDLMAKAGFNPTESVRLWENMSKTSGQGPPEFLSTHPANDQRIQYLQSHMAQARALFHEAQLNGRDPNCHK
ncbi:MAG: M48 family metallopeptidase [Bdellovibrionales bacterium]|nr:M48 family metallopeptidase [Bdellovibrionales bacterium]